MTVKLSQLDALLEYLLDRTKKIQVVLIAGATCSGKTTISQCIANRDQSILLHGDNWAMSESEIIASLGILDLESPLAYKIPELVSVLNQLLEGKQSLIPEFCFSQDRIINTHFIKKNKDQVLILDFLHAFANNIIEAIVDVPTLKVLIDAPMEVRFRRRIKRDIQERGKTLEQALMEWKLIEKSEKVFILDMKKKADIIFYNA